jgi:hypothetical protein
MQCWTTCAWSDCESPWACQAGSSYTCIGVHGSAREIGPKVALPVHSLLHIRGLILRMWRVVSVV